MKHRERRPVRGSESASLAWVRRWSAGPDECTRVAGQGGIGVGNFHTVSSKTRRSRGTSLGHWLCVCGKIEVHHPYNLRIIILWYSARYLSLACVLSCRVFAPLARIDAVVRGSPNHGTRSTVTEHARPIPCSWLAGA